MARWQVLTEAGLLLLALLLALVAAGVSVPLFRALLGLAVALLVLGALWRALELLRGEEAPGEAGGRGQAPALQQPVPDDEPKPAPAALESERAGRYRLLVADVDGTLVGPEQTISPRVRRAVALAAAVGIRVALCTGRSPGAARRFLAELALTGPHIFFDGALVAAPGAKEDVYCRPADPAALRELVACCEAEAIPCELYGPEQHYAARRTAASDWHSAIQGIAVQVADLDRVLVEETIVKGELISTDATTRTKIDSLATRFDGRLRFSWAKVPGYERYDLVNVVHPLVSKGEALRQLAAHLGVPLAAVCAVGDGRNDIPLLTAAGLGIAMGDAPAAVKAAAAVVTASAAEDGLALAIERFLLG